MRRNGRFWCCSLARMIKEIFINWELFFFCLMVFYSFSQQILVVAHLAQALPGQLLEKRAKGAGRKKKGLIYEVALEI